MKEKDAVALFLKGTMLVVGEYRSSKAETITWRDKTTRQMTSAPMLRHTIEVGDLSLAVSDRVDESFKVEEYKPQFKKGDKVILHLQSLQAAAGAVSARGTLEPLILGA